MIVRGTSSVVVALAAAVLLAGCGGPEPPAPEPSPDLEAWRSELDTWVAHREERLRQPDGWLTLVGLHWLEEGENRFGSGEGNEVVLESSAMAERAGAFVVEEGGVRVVLDADSGITVDGETVIEAAVATDADGPATLFESGSLSFYVISRERGFAVRVKDAESPVLTAFEGIQRFSADPTWRIDARFEPFDPPREVQVPNILGEPATELSPGEVVFDLAGRAFRLRALEGSDGELFLVFGDETNGHETYGGGRFVYSEVPTEAGTVVVDFNRAYNPPCVFTPYATCPLPPAENRIGVRIEAGEKMWGEGH